MTSEEKLQYYLRLSYPIEIIEDEGAIVASIPDLPGCNAFGENVESSLRSLKETKELWLKGRIDSGQPIPDPLTLEEYSGKFVLRIPKTLHRALDREAKHQGISLNQYILYLLAERHTLSLTQGNSVQFSDSTLHVRPQAGRTSEIRRKSSNSELNSPVRNVSRIAYAKRFGMRISSLRETYGQNFAPGYRGNMLLNTVLEREGVKSLNEYLKKKKK